MPETTAPTIRPATADDLDVVWSFIRKKAAFDNWLNRLEATPQTIAEAMFANPPLFGVLLAEVDSKAVGFATYFFTFSTYLARRCVWLDDLYVDEDASGHGVGTALLRALAQVAIKQGCPRLEWVTAAANDKAIGFYERLGADVCHAIRVCRLGEEAIADVAGRA